MSAHPGPADEELLDDVAAVFAASDPAPVEVLARAKAIAHLSRLDEELAELLDGAAMAGVRSTEVTERLRFASRSTTIELRLPADVAERRLVGQVHDVDPDDPPVVRLEQDGVEPLETRCDEDGLFVLREVPRGPVRLRVLGRHADVRTVWFTL